MKNTDPVFDTDMVNQIVSIVGNIIKTVKTNPLSDHEKEAVALITTGYVIVELMDKYLLSENVSPGMLDLVKQECDRVAHEIVVSNVVSIN